MWQTSDEAVSDIEEETNGRAGSALDTARALRALRQRWKIPAAFGVVGIIAGVLAFVLWPRSYQAEAVLRYTGESQDPFEAMGAALQTAVVPQQIERVRRELGRSETVDVLVQQIEVEVAAPPLMLVRASARDPQEAAALANATARSFLESRRRLAAARLEEDAARAEESVEASLRALSAVRRERDLFRQQAGIADLPAERQSLIEEAAALRTRAIEQRIEAAAQEARAGALRDAATNLPALTVTRRVASPHLESLREARRELRSARGTLTEEHPRVQGLKVRVAELERMVQEGGGTVERTVSNRAQQEAREQGETEATGDAEAAIQRAESYARLAEEAAERARELSEIEGQASELSTRVTLAEQSHQQAIAALAGARDSEPLPDYHSESEAVVPLEPEASKVPLAAGLGIPFGALLIGLLIALVADVGRLKVLTANEVAWWGGGPVLGVTRWPQEPRGLDALVLELEDIAAKAIGRTLVVPATEDERDLACAFAARLAEAPWMSGGIVDVESEPIDAVVVDDAKPLPAGSGGAQRDTIVMERPPQEVLDAILEGEQPGAGSAPMQAERLSRATVRMFVMPGQGLRVQGLEDAFGAPSSNAPEDDAGRVSFAGTAPVAISRPTLVMGHGQAQQVSPAESSVVVQGTVKVEGRPMVNQPRQSMIEVAVRSLLQEDIRYEPLPAEPDSSSVALAWNGPLEGPVLRRAARLADRVVVIVRGGVRSAVELRAVRPRMGRMDGVGFVVAGVPESLMDVDRVGDVEGFWRGGNADAKAPIQRVVTVKSRRA